MTINLNDYFCGGYFIAKKYKRPDIFPKTLPDSMLSLSACICDFFPGDFGYGWATSIEQSETMAKDFGLQNFDIKELIDCIQELYKKKEIGERSACSSLETARKLCKKYLSGIDDLVILGAGLYKASVDDFIKQTTPPVSRPGNYEAENIRTNIMKRLMPEQGQILGYELMAAYDWKSFFMHSWLCCFMVEEVQKKFGVLPNEHGFIDNFDDALKCADYITSSNLSEPGLWFPLLVVKYEI